MRRLSAVLTAATLLASLLPAAASALEPLDAETLQNTLTELIATHPTAKRTNVALKVTDLETGEVLFDQNSDKLFTPASNLKIYTSAAALDLLGPGYNPVSRVFPVIAKGRFEDSKNSSRHVLILESKADAMLSSEQLTVLADQTSEMILKSDGSFLDPEAEYTVQVATWLSLPDKGPGWMWDDEPDYYNMTVTRTMLDFNTLEVQVSPGEQGGQAIVTLDPPSEYPRVENRTMTGDGSAIRITREPFTDAIIVTGSIASDSESVKGRITMHDPPRWIAAVFTQMLLDRGVEVKKTNQIPFVATFPIKHDGEISQLPSIKGKTNAEAVKHFLKKSENAVGEMLLLTLSEKFGDGDKVSWPSGATVISDWLVEEAGLERDSFRLVDGSGLSRYNLISADSSIRLLDYMKNESPHFEPFFDGLPIYKVDLPKGGGAKWGGVPLAEFDDQRVFAKPGGMSGVSTISGYVQTLDGRWLAFSLLGNGYIGSSAPVRDLRNQVWTALVQYQSADVAVPAE